MTSLCADCGKNLALVGKQHRCTPRVTINLPIVNNKPIDLISSTVINTAAQRQAKWRTANIELNRLLAREGMRKKRQAEKSNAI